MKINFKRVICLILTLTITLSLPINASTTQNDIDVNALCKELFNNLTPEAKEEFVIIMQDEYNKGNSSLLDYHIQYVDQSYTSTGNKSLTSELYYSRADSLAYDLKQLNLPQAVEYALVAFGAALKVPVGNIVDAAIGLGLITVLIANWSTIASKWDSIITVFENHLPNVNGLNHAMTLIECHVVGEDLVFAERFPIINSGVKHIERATIQDIMRRGKGKYKAYYSKQQNKILLVYRIDKGVKGNVSRLWEDEWMYTARNVDLTGFYLFVLLGANNKVVFHAELRYGPFANTNLEYMRYKNDLTYRLFPLPIINEPKYLGPNTVPEIDDGGKHFFKG